MNSRDKGKRGELELSKVLKQYGYDCRRGQQYSGANGDADVVGLPGIHIECKRVERLDLVKAMHQSINDSRPNDIPVVMHRRNRCEWLVTSTIWWKDIVGYSGVAKIKTINLGERKKIPSFYDLLVGENKVVVYKLKDELFDYYTMKLKDWMEIYREWEAGR